jgi:phosphate transport system protein
MQLSEHTSRQYDAELETIRSRVLTMGELVESQVRRAIEALEHRDISMLDQVIDDDHRVNGLEVSIDESCSKIIARRQPTASDLRLVIMVVKTITDLERIGDEAKNIALMGKNLLQKKTLDRPRFEKVDHVANLSLIMLRKSLDAFANLDTSNVGQVIRQDERVDEEFRAIIRYLITFMMEDPRTISSALDILFMAKAIERIGDHAKNMSEYVIYMVNGRDVRHVAPEEIEREAQQPGRTDQP